MDFLMPSAASSDHKNQEGLSVVGQAFSLGALPRIIGLIHSSRRPPQRVTLRLTQEYGSIEVRQYPLRTPAAYGKRNISQHHKPEP